MHLAASTQRSARNKKGAECRSSRLESKGKSLIASARAAQSGASQTGEPLPNTACAATATTPSVSCTINLAASSEIGMGIADCNFAHKSVKAGNSVSVAFSATSNSNARMQAPASRLRKASMTSLRRITSRLCSKMSSCTDDVGTVTIFVFS